MDEIIDRTRLAEKIRTALDKLYELGAKSPS
jgi:chromosome condensin MukBEF MukE localization factor